MIRRTIKAAYFGESFLYFSVKFSLIIKPNLPPHQYCFFFFVRMHIIVHLKDCAAPPHASPLAGGVVDLIALAATDGDGIEGLEGAQAHPGDGHVVGGEHDQDGLGVIEGHRQVVAHGDHQGVGAAAEAPLTCGERCFGGGTETRETTEW